MKKVKMLLLAAVLLISLPVLSQGFPETDNDPVLQKIIEEGQTNNQTMVWLDYLTNRFGGRYIGSDAFDNAARWAVHQFQSWGCQVELQEAGEMPVGFNRGPWFGKMTAPEERHLYFGTDAFTAGTQGVQRGGVFILPDDSLAILEAKADMRGKWVLLHKAGKLGQRLGRRGEAPFLEAVLKEGGALGTIKRVPVPLNVLNVNVKSWEHLPTVPDIKLAEDDYDAILAQIEAGKEVELEFEIRNWFKMGPVKYHNVVAWLPGTEFPDEYIILSGHLDAFSGGTGAVDCGSGVTPAMEALRLMAQAGARPKRTVMVILFAGEEAGILGASAWTRQNPSKLEKVGVLINRDYTPGAVTGAMVPVSWEKDFKKITAPLHELSERFPFEGIEANPYPGVKSIRLGGTDASAFAMHGIPTLRLREESGYSYRRAWHTLFDTYNEVVPYSEHQEHTALCLAVMAYGLGNLDHQLSRDGVYLPDGLYADFRTEKGRMIARLDYDKVPETVKAFVGLFEDPHARFSPWWRPRGAKAGDFVKTDEKGLSEGTITDEKLLKRAVKKLGTETHPELKHQKPGVVGMMAPDRFYITSGKAKSCDERFTAIGQVIAGKEIPKSIAAGDTLAAVRIIRVGDKAMGFGK